MIASGDTVNMNHVIISRSHKRFEFMSFLVCVKSNCRDNDCATPVKPDEARSSADCAPYAGVGICGGYGAKARMRLK